jgi:hypothetical protein
MHRNLVSEVSHPPVSLHQYTGDAAPPLLNSEPEVERKEGDPKFDALLMSFSTIALPMWCFDNGCLFRLGVGGGGSSTLYSTVR